MLLAALLAAPAAAAAQDYSGSAGWDAGILSVGRLNAGAGQVAGAGGTQLPADAIEPGLTWVFGAHYDQWYGRGMVGFRLGGAFTQHRLEWERGERSFNIYMADATLLLRPIPPTPGGAFSITLGAGIGGVRYALGEGPPTVHPDADAVYLGDERFQLAGVGSVAVDVGSPWFWDHSPVFVRIKASDHMALSSPFERTDGADFDAVHNLRLSVGIHAGVGSLF